MIKKRRYFPPRGFFRCQTLCARRTAHPPRASMANPMVHNMVHHMPMPVDGVVMRQAILDDYALGRAVAREIGDAAYRHLRV